MTSQTLALPLTFSLKLLEKGLLPDWLIRIGIRRLLKERLREEDQGSPEAQQAHLTRFIGRLKQSALAVHTAEANQQHYEVPSEFFEQVLGPHLKYSCAYFKNARDALGEAEATMLALTCRRAALKDGEQILELGCGWGSLTLWMAEHYPNARIVAVSNSRSQKRFIESRARERGLHNVEIITCDVNSLKFPAGTAFDRVVSVEMFEHIRNYETLMGRIAGWLKPEGTLFVHIFSHQRFAYAFEVRDESDWMAKYFFTGGIMPSDDLLLYFQEDLSLESHWQVDGTHYGRTAEAWLTNMDSNAAAIKPLFQRTYGVEAKRFTQYWRVFFMACAELWNYSSGREWLVSHYLFRKRSP